MKVQRTIQYLNAGCFGDEQPMNISYRLHETDTVGLYDSVELIEIYWEGVDVFNNLQVSAHNDLEELILDELKGAE